MKHHLWQGTLTAACLLLAASSLAGQELRVSKGLAQYLALVQFSIESGQIRCVSLHGGRSITSSTSGPGAHRSEQLSINIVGRVPSIKYEASTPEYQLNLEFSDGNVIKLRRTPRGPAEVVGIDFAQQGDHDLTLTVHQGDQKREISAKTLWHLLILEQELCRQHLVPLLELLHPDFGLMDQAAAVEDALVARAALQDQEDGSRWRTLVAQLGSDRFAARRAAERQLLHGGERAAAVLETLDLNELDAEQRFRVRRLIDQLSGGGGDRPQRVATRLSYDPLIWLSLLDRSDLEVRRTAHKQLARMLGREIDFDPAASPDAREAALARLRSEIAGK